MKIEKIGQSVMRQALVIAWSVLAIPALAANVDTDGDGRIDLLDNCSEVANPDQVDGDLDGIGNRCDADLNNDCIVNVVDLGLLRQRFFTDDAAADMSGDGVVNAVDLGLMRQAFFIEPGPSGQPNRCTRPATGLVYAGTHADFPGATADEEHLFLVDLELPGPVKRLTPVLPQQSRSLKVFRNSVEESRFKLLPDNSAVIFSRPPGQTTTCTHLLKSSLDQPGMSTSLSTGSAPCLGGRQLALSVQGDVAYFLGSDTGLGLLSIFGVATDGTGTQTFQSASAGLAGSLLMPGIDDRWLHYTRYDTTTNNYQAWAENVGDPASEAQLYYGPGSGSYSKVRTLPDGSGFVIQANDGVTNTTNVLAFDYDNLSVPLRLNPELTVFESASQPQLSPDGKTVYYLRTFRNNNQTTYKLMAVDLDTPGQEIELADVAYGRGPFEVSPDGSIIALADDGSPGIDFRLRLISTDPDVSPITVDRRIRQYDRVQATDVARDNVMQFDPSGSHLYFTTSRPAGDPGRVFRVATGGDGVSEQIGTDHDSLFPPELMLVSADGKYVAYTITVDYPGRELFVVATDQPTVAIKLNGKIDSLTLVDDFEFVYGPLP